MQSTLPVDVLDLVPSKFWFEPPMSESNDSETLLRVAFQNRCKVFWHCKEMNTITREPISDSSVTNSKKRRQKPKNYRFTVQAPTLTTTLNTNFGATKSLSWSMLNHPGKKVPKSWFCSSENSFQMNRIYFWDKIMDIPGQRYICRKMYKRKNKTNFKTTCTSLHFGHLTRLSSAETSHNLWCTFHVGIHTFLPEETSYYTHSLERWRKRELAHNTNLIGCLHMHT